MSRVACGEVRLVRSLLARSAREHLDALRDELERQLRTLPVPLHHSHPLTRERSSLMTLRDTIDACLGMPEALLREARERWLAGGSHVEYLRLLVQNGHSARAVSMAIALLDANEQRDRQELETLLAEVSLAPSGTCVLDAVNYDENTQWNTNHQLALHWDMTGDPKVLIRRLPVVTAR